MKSHKLAAALLSSSTAAAQNTKYGPPFYDETWAGPVRIAENFNASSNSSGFNMVEATMVMPGLDIPKNPTQRVDEYSAFFWVGLDGFFPGSDAKSVHGLWQAGVTMSVWENGTKGYTGFYEWVPNDPVSLTSSQLAISEGDHVHVVINTTEGGYYGSTTLTNLNTSQSFSYGQEAPTTWRGPTWPSPGSSAEWIIEAGTYLNTTQVVFPNWGNATFLDARACYGSGECVTPGDSGATKDNTRITAMLWNDTDTLYTQSYVDEAKIWISYVEEYLGL